jgi:hypothetical protein
MCSGVCGVQTLAIIVCGNSYTSGRVHYIALNLRRREEVLEIAVIIPMFPGSFKGDAVTAWMIGHAQAGAMREVFGLNRFQVRACIVEAAEYCKLLYVSNDCTVGIWARIPHCKIAAPWKA